MSCRNRLCQRTANAKNVTQFLTGYNQPKRLVSTDFWHHNR